MRRQLGILRRKDSTKARNAGEKKKVSFTKATIKKAEELAKKSLLSEKALTLSPWSLKIVDQKAQAHYIQYQR